MPEVHDLRGALAPTRGPRGTHPILNCLDGMKTPQKFRQTAPAPRPLTQSLKHTCAPSTWPAPRQGLALSPLRVAPSSSPCPCGSSSVMEAEPPPDPVAVPEVPEPGLHSHPVPLLDPRTPALLRWGTGTCPTQNGPAGSNSAPSPCRHLATLTLLRARNSTAGMSHHPPGQTQPRAARPLTVARPRPLGPDMAEFSPVSGATSPPHSLTPAGGLGP